MPCPANCDKDVLFIPPVSVYLLQFFLRYRIVLVHNSERAGEIITVLL